MPQWLINVLVLLLLLAFLSVIGFLTGRILGVRRTAPRAIVGGLLGLAGGVVLTGWEFRGQTDPTAAEFLALAGSTLLSTLIASVVLDRLLKPPNPDRPRGLLSFARWVRLQWQTGTRILQIAGYARKRGLAVAKFNTPEGAVALREVLEHSGGMLVKFGQIASTRDDLLPEVLTTELASLRTSVPPLPFDVVRDSVETELGAPLDELFADFDHEPLAAASIGVTHRAVLADGRRVIVKVQRPDVEEAVVRDGRVMRWGANMLERRWAHFSTMGISALADELVDSVEKELDFTKEQANNAAMREARKGDQGVRFPEILPDWTTRKVLVMDEVDGVPVSDTAAVAATGRPRGEIADNLLRSFLGQALTDGRFHADPHPGNVLIDAAGDLWLIDYGAVGTIDPITLEALQLLAAGFIMRDPSLAARAVRRMVGPQGTQVDIAALETDMAMLLGQFSASGIDPEIIGSVVETLSRFGIAAPRALTVLGRAALTIDGTLRIIDPDFQMGARSQEHLRPLASGELSNPRDILTKELIRAMPSLRTLPMLTEDLGLQARDGLLTLRTERYATGDAVQVSSWIDHVLFAAIAMVGFLGSGLLLLAGAIAEGEESARFLYALGFSGLLLSVTAMLRSVAQLREPRRGKRR